MTPWLHVLTLDLAVVGAAAAVMLVDALVPLRGRTLGWLVAACLTGVFAASFFVDVAGVTPHGAYVSDAWVLFFKRVFLAAAILGVLGSIDWLEARTPRRQAEYYALVLFSLVGMMLLPGARDWVLLVVAFELMGVPLYVLAAYAKQDGPPDEPKLAAEAGLKLFVTGAASSAFTFFGLALLVGLSGSTRIADVGALSPLAAVGLLFVIAGFGFKLGAVPFHMWIPDTYQGAPTPFVAFLSVAPKAGGLAALAVILMSSGWIGEQRLWAPAIVLISIASMAVGNLFALPQTDARRLLGFSGIAQIGYALIALASATEQGLSMTLFFIASYVFTNLGVFLVVHAAAENMGGHSIARMSGLSRRSPWLGGALLVFLLSLAGVPFVIGFWAKLFVFLAAYRAGLYAPVIVGVVLAVVGLFYYLSIARSTFMADGTSDTKIQAGLGLRTAIGICLVAVIALGLWPGPLVESATAAARAFLAAR
ncbi:MAG: NADH-quinone oxidoreductase subunit N [Planctomycetes bacterium]|nr:NADH-quinone oxidoreductase subunit N [Planctomycetota bacterium]